MPAWTLAVKQYAIPQSRQTQNKTQSRTQKASVVNLRRSDTLCGKSVSHRAINNLKHKRKAQCRLLGFDPKKSQFGPNFNRTVVRFTVPINGVAVSRRPVCVSGVLHLGPLRRGTVLRRFVPCGKPGYRCQAEPPPRGPAYMLMLMLMVMVRGRDDDQGLVRFWQNTAEPRAVRCRTGAEKAAITRDLVFGEGLAHCERSSARTPMMTWSKIGKRAITFRGWYQVDRVLSTFARLLYDT